MCNSIIYATIPSLIKFTRVTPKHHHMLLYLQNTFVFGLHFRHITYKVLYLSFLNICLHVLPPLTSIKYLSMQQITVLRTIHYKLILSFIHLQALSRIHILKPDSTSLPRFCYIVRASVENTATSFCTKT